MTETLTANEIPKLLQASYQNLKRHQEEIDKLNVFPVPDGDTGTNLVLTVEAVINEVVQLSDFDMKQLCESMTQGSLLGARGNSGVILSQIIRGICDVLKEKKAIDIPVIADALKVGQKVAYQAIKKPVEGTMLTVIKDMASEAERIAEGTESIEEFLETIIIEAQLSVNRTPELLPVLKEAGVIDAGGHGIAVLAEGLLFGLKGEALEAKEVLSESIPAFMFEEESDYGYCTEFLIKSEKKELSSLEEKISHLGDSVLVVGSDFIRRVHIHTDSPGKVIDIATDIGSVSKIQINNMDEQSAIRKQAIKDNLQSKQGIGIISVANGLGIKEILYSLGVNYIIDGGQSMNPSTADFIKAIDELPQDNIIILPNNKNILLSARQAVESSSKNIALVETKFIPQAFTALLELNQNDSLQKNIERMEKAFSHTKTGEVTMAVRDSELNNHKIKKDDYIGLANGEIEVTGKDFSKVALELIKKIATKDDESLILLKGAEAKHSDIEQISEKIEKQIPWLETEIHNGGQPLYHLIFSIE